MKTKLIIASCLVAAVTFVLIYSSCKKKTDDTEKSSAPSGAEDINPDDIPF